jgi:ribosomal-protein-alanine N-acetyltransferase
MLDASLLPLTLHGMRLRPLRTTDAVPFAEGAADPSVRRYGHLPEAGYTPNSVTAMIEREAEPGLARGDLAVLAIADVGSDAFAGSLVIFDVRAAQAEVGFWVHPAHRGCGVGAAALELAARFVRASGLGRLTARTLPGNAASQKVLDAAGFTLMRSGAEATPSGETMELLHYSRTLRDS